MTFAVDTGQTGPQIFAKSSGIGPGQNVSFTDGNRAERVHRQIIEAIEAHEDPDDLDKYVADESLIIDALYLSFPDYAQAVVDARDTHRQVLIDGLRWEAAQAEAKNTLAQANGSGAPVTAHQPTSLNKGKTMSNFEVDTGDTGGTLGPWMAWSSNGSATKGFEPKSWNIRGKNDDGDKEEYQLPRDTGFEGAGCVLDLDSLQLGWQKDGGTGMAPEKRWNPSLAQFAPRPDDSKKPSGAYAWSQALSIRCAIGDGKAATWEQSSFGAYDAFAKLLKQISAQHPGDNTLPLVKQTGVEAQTLKSGTSNKPVLEIVAWVARPDCLKADFQPDTGEAAKADVQKKQEAAAATAASPKAEEAAAAAGF